MTSNGAPTTWDGNSMSQADFMEKDTVLVLDRKDKVIGSASKRASHEFTGETPRGILHRAFSVFLFDESTGELLLQQRASTKITFPNVRYCASTKYKCTATCGSIFRDLRAHTTLKRIVE
jgi:isopentenyldiphosphate isomerase